MSDLLLKMPLNYEPLRQNRWLLRFPSDLGLHSLHKQILETWIIQVMNLQKLQSLYKWTIVFWLINPKTNVKK